MQTLQYTLKRLAFMLPTFLLVAIIVFLLVRALPGDPAIALAGDRASNADLDAIRERLGLNEPLVVQFFIFISNLVRGDLGHSILLRGPVLDIIIARLPTTLFLTVYAIALSVAIACPLALWAAMRKGQRVDNVIRSLFQVGLSMPVFYIGLLLLTLFAAQLRWFPVGGYGESFFDRAYHLFLPAVTVAFYTSAIIMRNLRSAIIDVLEADYVEFARAKGLPNRVVVTDHVLRNTLISTVTLIGLSIGNLMSGTLVTETVFAVPGLGRLMLEAIFARDYPLIQGLTLTFALLVSLVFLITDLAQSWIDPRVELK
ncbi:ABC transporter permease [Pelagibacterium sp.]|uniref:ABC transporter permease n=1 Tax=Pelagibacterium sp. TaxID=1967288 RepID=UPI003A8D618D